MKIIKILFLGIVLVLFNIAYLAAQAPADTVFVKTKPVAPGGVLEITYEIHINSASVGGIIIVIEGVPEQITQPAGDEWYTWGEGFGSVLAEETSWPIVAALDEVGLQVALLGVDIDDLVADGDLASKSGDFITYLLPIPADMALGTYPLVRSSQEDGVVLPSYPIPGPNIQPYPAVVADPILVTEIPDYNALELPEITEVVSTGGDLILPINVLNKDEIGSGSFKVSFPADILDLTGVTAASRAGGMEFTIADVSTSDDVTTATISFTGGAVALGGLGELCSLEFEVSALSAGAVSISLADVSLSDAAGALPDLQQPTVGSTEPEMVFGDSLIVGVKTGAHEAGQADEESGISVIIDGQLLLPVLLTNSKPVSVLDFFIQKVPGNEAITLTLAEIQKARTADWIIDSKDTVDFVHVVGFQNPAGAPIAAGDGEILTLVFDIGGWEGVITADNSVDVSLVLKGAEVVDSDGNFLAVQQISNVATIDNRVPLSAEGLGAGASLPKAFALSQNHPNPFNPSTTINYQVPEDVGFVSFSLNVYDIRGSLVRTLANGVKGPGYYTAHWNGTDNNGRQLSSGVYFYRLRSDKYTSTRKMVLLK